MQLSDKYERYEVLYQGFLFTHTVIFSGLSPFHVRVKCEEENPACKVLTIKKLAV